MGPILIPSTIPVAAHTTVESRSSFNRQVMVADWASSAVSIQILEARFGGLLFWAIRNRYLPLPVSAFKKNCARKNGIFAQRLLLVLRTLGMSSQTQTAMVEVSARKGPTAVDTSL